MILSIILAKKQQNNVFCKCLGDLINYIIDGLFPKVDRKFQKNYLAKVEQNIKFWGCGVRLRQILYTVNVAEILKIFKEVIVLILKKICDKIGNTVTWPLDWIISMYISLPKRGSKAKPSSYRTEALIFLCSKVMLSILHEKVHKLRWRTDFEY